MDLEVSKAIKEDRGALVSCHSHILYIFHIFPPPFGVSLIFCLPFFVFFGHEDFRQTKADKQSSCV